MISFKREQTINNFYFLDDFFKEDYVSQRRFSNDNGLLVQFFKNEVII